MGRAMLDLIMQTSGRAKTPEGYTSKDIVTAAVEFKNPPRIPYYLNTHNSDIMHIANIAGKTRNPIDDKTYFDEWGVKWEITGRGWGHAFGYPLEDLSKLDEYKFPKFPYDQADPGAQQQINMGRENGKYLLATNMVNMFELLRSLMGFEGLMMAPYLYPEKFKELLDKLTDLTIDYIDSLQLSGGVDGFMTIEDWGLQKGLQLSLDQFREFYKPVYQRVIDRCHKNGIHFWWHCCGDIIDLLPEMVEMKVNVVQLDQPMLMGYEEAIKASQGKLAFHNALDIQWYVPGETTIDEIKAETKNMVNTFQRLMPNGGFIMRTYVAPEDIGMTLEGDLATAEAFFEAANIDDYEPAF